MADHHIDYVLAKLREAGADPRRNGAGWKAHCQAHHDEHPSLYVKVGENGRVLIKCHAGCQFGEVLRAHGLRRSDLAPASNGKVVSSTATVTPDADPLPTEQQLVKWRSALTQNKVWPAFRWQLSTLRKLGVGYDGERFKLPIRDADDKLVNVVSYRLLRSLEEDRRRTPKMIALKGRPRDLFPSPESVKGDHILLVEGEPDALSGQSIGLPAVAVPGANGWKNEWCSRFADKRVTICFDADDQGRKAARKIAYALADHGIHVKVADLAPDRTDGFDLKQQIQEARSARAARQHVRGLIARATAVEAHNGAEIVRYADVAPEHVRWLRPGVPRRMLALLGGHAGLGKTMLTQSWAAETTRGDLLSKPAGVLMISGEDPPSMARARLEAAGADLGRVGFLRIKRDGEEVGITLPDDIPVIEQEAKSRGIALIVIDPINAFFAAGIDYFRDTDTRRIFGPLARMAERLDVAVVVVSHLTKGQTSEALHRIGGSVGYGAAVRSAFIFDRDPDDEDGEQGTQRILVHAKCNVGPLEPSVVYKVEPATVDKDVATARLEEIGESEYGANALLAKNASRDSSKETAQARVAGSLRILLADGEPHERSEVVEAASNVTGASERTIKRVAKDIGVQIEDTKTWPRRTLWQLPRSRATSAGPTGDGPTGPTGANVAVEPNPTSKHSQSGQQADMARLDRNPWRRRTR